MGKSHWIKDQKGNFSNDKNDTFDPKNDYIGIRLQQGVPLLDRDWNELEDIRRYQEQRLRDKYIGDGTVDNGFEITVDDTIQGFSISKGSYIVKGLEVNNRDFNNYNELKEKEKISDLPSDNADFFIYLQARIEEVAGPDNYQDASIETCKHHVVKWNLKIVGSEINLSEHEYVYSTKLYKVSFENGKIEPKSIEDYRFTILRQSNKFYTIKHLIQPGSTSFPLGDVMIGTDCIINVIPAYSAERTDMTWSRGIIYHEDKNQFGLYFNNYSSKTKEVNIHIHKRIKLGEIR